MPRQQQKRKSTAGGDEPKKKVNRAAKSNEATISDAKAVEPGAYDDLATYLNPEWRQILKPALESDYFKQIVASLNSQKTQCFPPKAQIFNAFNLTSPEKVKIVILGQDPYHDEGQAHGLAFSVPRSVKVPPSLKTLYKELNEDPDVKFTPPTHGCLEKWAQQGVLLLNAFLTVEAHKPKSHRRIGWDSFTDDVIRLLCEKHKRLVFIFWGKDAQQKRRAVVGSHVILEGAHPSTMTCGKFYGCRHFSKANKELKEPIDWQL